MGWLQNLFGRKETTAAPHNAVASKGGEGSTLIDAPRTDAEAPSRVQKATTPLHRAAANCDADGVRTLLAGRVDVNARDEKGNTPLRLTVSIEVAELLIGKGADWAANDDGLTPLHRAAWSGNGGLTLLYLRNGAVAEPGTSATTPLISAVKDGRLGQEFVVALLVTHGANPIARNENGISPLTHANAQAMRDALLVVAALDHVVKSADGDLSEAARRVRGRALGIIDESMLQGVSLPGDLLLRADTGPRADQLWEQDMRVRSKNLQQQLNVFERMLFLEEEALADALGAAKRAVASAHS